jgi:hypothetical protein
VDDNQLLGRLLIDELEQLLASYPRSEDEADSAGLYVESPHGARGSVAEQLAGVPNGGAFKLIGPDLLLAIAQTAIEVLEDLNEDPGHAVATASAIGWLRRRFVKLRSRKQSDRTRRDDAVRAVATALVGAGWNEEDAEAAAQEAWTRGRRLGTRIAGVMCDQEEIHGVYDAALAVSLQHSRDALLGSIDPHVTSTLPSLPDHGSQMLSDLQALNRIVLRDGSCPLVAWLSTAAALRAAHLESQVFHAVLLRLRSAGRKTEQ